VTKSAADLDDDIAESLRAKQWQEQVEREHRERQERQALAAITPTPEQLYEEYQSDLGPGVFHGEQRGRAKSFRKIATAAEALRASEHAKRLTDDAYSPDEHRAAADAHRRAARLHKSDPTGAEAAWLHDLAESNHRQAAKWRSAASKGDPVRAIQTKKSFASYQEKMAAAREHGIMAEEYARQALAAAKKRA